MRQIWLFDRILDATDPLRLTVRPARLAALGAGVAVFAIPAAMLHLVTYRGWEPGPKSIIAGVALALVALALVVVPLLPSNVPFVLDLRQATLTVRGVTVPLAEARLRAERGGTARHARAALWADVGGRSVRLLYLANEATELVTLLAAAPEAAPDRFALAMSRTAEELAARFFAINALVYATPIVGGAAMIALSR